MNELWTSTPPGSDCWFVGRDCHGSELPCEYVASAELVRVLGGGTYSLSRWKLFEYQFGPRIPTASELHESAVRTSELERRVRELENDANRLRVDLAEARGTADGLRTGHEMQKGAWKP